MDDEPAHHPLAGPDVSRFLVDSGAGLIARLDADGRILAASGRLAGRLPQGGRVDLPGLLTAKGARRWRCLLRDLEPGGPPLRSALRFRGIGMPIALAALVHREQDGRIWLLAVPEIARDLIDDRGPSREVAGLERSPARSDRMALLLLRARREAMTDPLTGLANRRQGARWSRTLVARQQRDGTPLACVVLDVDGFKAINDRFGHPVGDRVLRVVARIVAAQLRPDDRLYRLGGEEFVALLPGTGLDGAVAVADRLRLALRSRPIRPLDHPIAASFGVACLRPGESSPSLLARADAALGLAKRLGRDRVEADP